MNQELRIYAVNEGRMDDWIGIFQKHIVPFHDAHGYRVRIGWVDAAKNHFVWIRDVGDEAAMKRFTEEMIAQDFITQIRDTGVKVVETRTLRQAVGPRF